MNLSLEHRTFFLVGFVLYIGAMILIGVFSSRNNKDGDDYLMAGRKLPFFLVLGTVCATLIGTGSSLGATANGFRLGWGGSLYGLGGAWGMFAIALFFCSERKHEFMTLSEELQYRYGGNQTIRNVMGFFMFIAEIAWLGNHMIGGATYLSYVTGLSPIAARLITMLGFGIYVFIGGYLAVVWTDTIQLVLVLFGFLLISFNAIPLAGGWEAVSAAYMAAGKPEAMSFYGLAGMSAISAISLVYTIGISQVGTPSFRTRVYTSKDNSTARKAFITSGILLFLFSFVPAIIGMSGFTIATREGATSILQNPDYAFAYIATTVLGPTMGLLFLISGLSAHVIRRLRRDGRHNYPACGRLFNRNQKERPEGKNDRLLTRQPRYHAGSRVSRYPVRQGHHKLYFQRRWLSDTKHRHHDDSRQVLEAGDLAGRLGLRLLRDFVRPCVPFRSAFQDVYLRRLRRPGHPGQPDSPCGGSGREPPHQQGRGFAGKGDAHGIAVARTLVMVNCIRI